jgi:NADP-dependent 3-hydroxy acid dehydrogenase YdfG
LIDDLNMEGFNVVMETNLQGMDLNLKYVVRGVILTKQGVIICPRNIVAMMGRMTNGSYSSSKVVIAIVHSNVYLQVMNFLFWSPLCIIGYYMLLYDRK